MYFDIWHDVTIIFYSILKLNKYNLSIWEFETGFTSEVVPLFSQVESRRPVNNPIQGRCY